MIEKTPAISIRAVVQIEICWCEDDFLTEEEWLDFKVACQTSGDFAKEQLMANLDGGSIEEDVVVQIEDGSAEIKVLEGVHHHKQGFVFDTEIQFRNLKR